MIPFIDTNILLYALSDDPRQALANEILDRPFQLSVQVLNEFASAMRRKLRLSWEAIEDKIADTVAVAAYVHPVDLHCHIRGLAFASRYKLQFYDAVLLATAVKSGTDTLFTEDMHDGLVVEGSLVLRNPFA